MKLLFVDCCISQRGEASRTRALCQAYLDGFVDTHPDVLIDTLDVKKCTLKAFNRELLDQRDALRLAGRFDQPEFQLARQFRDADFVLVGAPFWDLSFPAILRVYIEHISANGVTYFYDETGSHGVCHAKSLVYITTGGDYERPESLGILYWKQLCRMFGIPVFESVFAGGLDIQPEQAGKAVDEAGIYAYALGRNLA